MSVIDSLSAGFRFLGKRVELLLIPIVLDLILWLSPRLSITPLVEQLEQQMLQSASTPDVPPDFLAFTQQAIQEMETLTSGINLFSALVNQSLLHVPSLMAALPWNGTTQGVRLISDMGVFTLSLILLTLAGMWIGALYLNTLARHLPLGEGSKTLSFTEFMKGVFQHWFWLLLFVLGLGMALLLLSIPILAMTLVMMALSPNLASGAMMLSFGMTLALLFYMYFVVAGLILDNLSLPSAVWRSVLLVRYNFWSTLGFIGVTFFITVGFVQIWLILVGSMTSPVVLFLAVLGNAYIGTGLAMSLLVFYRTRLLRMAEQLNPAA